ncbi:MAG: hypothetical protein JXJ04_23025 [Spirochaetales bacterium]|nr:hypothetical protein [Spirochaetales bacterium]
MGITIAYKGKLNNTDLIYRFCEELSDIADEMNWEYRILNEDFNLPHTACLDSEGPEVQIKGHLPLKGISMKIHPQSQSLSFHFDKHGNIRNIVTMVMNEADEHCDNSFEFIKTAYAPVEVHITVVKLLRYIKETYISNLYVLDDSNYWETGDETMLNDKKGPPGKNTDTEKIDKLLIRKYDEVDAAG